MTEGVVGVPGLRGECAGLFCHPTPPSLPPLFPHLSLPPGEASPLCSAPLASTLPPLPELQAHPSSVHPDLCCLQLSVFALFVPTLAFQTGSPAQLPLLCLLTCRIREFGVISVVES